MYMYIYIYIYLYVYVYRKYVQLYNVHIIAAIINMHTACGNPAGTSGSSASAGPLPGRSSPSRARRPLSPPR